MVANIEKRRSEEVRVKLSPALAAELAGIAEARGLLPATLAAVALGEYVEKYRQNLQIQRMVAIDASKRMSEMALDEEKLGKAIAEALGNPDLLAVMAGSTVPEAGAQA